MNQEQLVAKTSKTTALPQKIVERCFQGMVDTIEQSLIDGEKISIRRFGTLRVTQRKQRNAVDPRTLESVVLPASNRIKFDAAPILIDKIQGV